MKLAVEVGKTVLVDLMPSQNHACTRHEMKKVMIRLDPGGRRVKSRIRTGDVYYRGKRKKNAYKTREQSESISLAANVKARICSRLAVRVSVRVRSQYALLNYTKTHSLSILINN